MERAWMIIAGLCLVAATFFLWRENLDAVVVAATLSAVAWFLGLRDRLRKTIVAADKENEAQDIDESGDNHDD
jgi:hypothetical protein